MSRLIDADALIEFCAERWIPLNIDAVNMQPTIQPVATDTNAGNNSVIPNSSDAVSRQAAIDEIKNYCENGCDIAEDNWCPSCQREQFIELLKVLPPAQPEPHWIPVSERLPEESGYYITSNEYNGVGEDFYYDGHFWNADKNAYSVIAWMPLPKPFEGGAE